MQYRRTNLVPWLVAIGLVLATISARQVGAAPAKPEKPNVLFIAVDDLND